MQLDLGAVTKVIYGNAIQPYLEKYGELKNKIETTLTFPMQGQINSTFKNKEFKLGNVSIGKANIGYFKNFEIVLRPMFKSASMTEQSIKLGCMLSYVISKFESKDDMMGEVKALAERHTKYGVKDEHYKAVGEALIWTLEQGLGEYWDEALNMAWKNFYETLSSAMMASQH